MSDSHIVQNFQILESGEDQSFEKLNLASRIVDPIEIDEELRKDIIYEENDVKFAEFGLKCHYDKPNLDEIKRKLSEINKKVTKRESINKFNNMNVQELKSEIKEKYESYKDLFNELKTQSKVEIIQNCQNI